MVQIAAHTWLTVQKISTVTPTLFAHGPNESILPSLNVVLQKALCECTAHQWLVKLCWTQQTLHKGMYMDGHECPDVVQYQKEVFLPKMAAFEQQMVKFDFDHSILQHMEPQLQLGECIIIPVWQDESCFHANEYKKSAWYD